MSTTRRDFIKYVVAGSITSGCPIDSTLIAAPNTSPKLESEHFEICHQVRDGHQFDLPSPTKKTDILIIGGGVAGLSAAYFLHGKDFLLLEKEPHFGGNAYQEDYDGAIFGTGSAYAEKGDNGDQLCKEMGLTLLPVDCPDPTIINGTFVPDTWVTGLDHLPYKKEVRDSFKKFAGDMKKIKVAERMEELDALPFTNFTKGYAPEVQKWWDAFGPSNWGATSEDTSAMIGIGSVQALVKGEDSQRVILPGGLGCITHKLVEVLAPKYQDRMFSDAAVVAVVQTKDGVNATYFHEGQLTTVSAKAAIVCTPKHITSRFVHDLPAPQKTAMHRTRYAPYPVINAIFDKPVYNRGFDNWCPGNTFTDFIVADWTIRNTPGYHQKYNVLTFYTPLREHMRSTLLVEDECKSLAARVLADFQKLMPEFNVNPLEVRIYRRGHPMFMAVPGQYTKNRLAAAQSMDRIFFGNADSGGPESLTSEAIRLSKAAVEWSDLILSGKPGARDFALKALTAAPE